jgi:hypothetical protein
MENGYICGYDPAITTDTLKRCVPKPCPTGTVVCVTCNETGKSSQYCRSLYNGTLTVSCAETKSLCTVGGGSIENPQTSTSQDVTMNQLFNQIINLIFYTFVVAILFMIIALVIAGLHLAYGLIKR